MDVQSENYKFTLLFLFLAMMHDKFPRSKHNDSVTNFLILKYILIIYNTFYHHVNHPF